jgi:hypothetical protein
MEAMDALDLLDLLDKVDGELLAFGLLVLGLFHPLDHGIGNMHAGHIAAHPARGLRGRQGTHADEEEGLLMQTLRPHLVHEIAEHRHVIAILRLDELRAGGDLLADMDSAMLQRRHEGIGRTTQEHPRRHRDLAAGEELAVIAHAADAVEERCRIEIEHRLGFRLVARLHAVAGQAQDVLHTHGGSTQHIALDGDAVPVATRDLHDHRIARPREERADADRGHVAVGAGRIGRVDRVAHFREHQGTVIDVARIG